MLATKPWSESCEQNRKPILSVIKPILANRKKLLEIGSGTGQHAVYFAPEFPYLTWHTSDCQENLPGINMWLEECESVNICPPLELDVERSAWPDIKVDAIYSANTLHIMPWTGVEAFFKGTGTILETDGCLLVYGPFNYNRQYTSDSNAQFDVWLKQRDPRSGIRHFEDLAALAKNAGLELVEDFAMPANNRILYWRKCR